MPGARRTRKGQNAVGSSTEVKAGSGQFGGLQNFDGANNTQSDDSFDTPTPDFEGPSLIKTRQS